MMPDWHHADSGSKHHRGQRTINKPHYVTIQCSRKKEITFDFMIADNSQKSLFLLVDFNYKTSLNSTLCVFSYICTHVKVVEHYIYSF